MNTCFLVFWDGGFAEAIRGREGGGSSEWSVHGGRSTDGLFGACNDLQIWCVLLLGAKHCTYLYVMKVRLFMIVLTIHALVHACIQLCQPP